MDECSAQMYPAEFLMVYQETYPGCTAGKMRKMEKSGEMEANGYATRIWCPCMVWAGTRAAFYHGAVIPYRGLIVADTQAKQQHYTFHITQTRMHASVCLTLVAYTPLVFAGKHS